MYHWIRKIGCILLILTCLWMPQVQAQAPEYLQQETGDSCTLCSSTMLIRSLFACSGSDAWSQVTEADVRGKAWTSAGLSWNWSYSVGEDRVTVGHAGTQGMSLEQVQRLLSLHPEGFVLYCGGSQPHAVFVTDVTEDNLYCADPAWGYAGDRIPVADSLLGKRHGSQEDILASVTAYWYIADSDITASEPARQVCPPERSLGLQESAPARL